jgi:hypothetical protein
MSLSTRQVPFLSHKYWVCWQVSFRWSWDDAAWSHCTATCMQVTLTVTTCSSSGSSCFGSSGHSFLCHVCLSLHLELWLPGLSHSSHLEPNSDLAVGLMLVSPESMHGTVKYPSLLTTKTRFWAYKASYPAGADENSLRCRQTRKLHLVYTYFSEVCIKDKSPIKVCAFFKTGTTAYAIWTYVFAIGN